MISIVLPVYKYYPDLERLKRLYPDAEIIAEYDMWGQGKGMTLKRGSLKATGDYIVWIDADYELPPEQIKNLFAVNTDIVVGCKLHKDSKVDYTPIRRMVSLICYWITKLLFRLPIHDTQTGLKLFKKEVLDRVLPLTHIKGYAFDVEVLVLAKKMGYTIGEIPVTVKSKEGQSSITLVSLWITFWDMISILRRTRCGGFIGHH